MNISEHFTLAELTKSATAKRLGYTEQFSPPQDVIDNLTYTAVNLLEPIRSMVGHPITVSSAYRCPRLNVHVGSKTTSQHLTGNAVDIDFGNKEDNKKLFNLIKDSGLDYDQLLNEYDYDWIHVSLKKTGNRKQVLNII